MALFACMEFEFAGNHFRAIPGKALFWEEESALLLSDLHIGKTQHFRKNGIPVPVLAADKNLEKLHALLEFPELKEVIMVGDLFHSDMNQEWEHFVELRKHYASVRWTLIRGNHDRIPAYLLKEAQIEALHKTERNGIELIHEPEENPSKPSISGHIHPAITLRGKGRWSETLPCLAVSSLQILLPAFGSFTGKQVIQAHEGQRIFVFPGNSVLEV